MQRWLGFGLVAVVVASASLAAPRTPRSPVKQAAKPTPGRATPAGKTATKRPTEPSTKPKPDRSPVLVKLEVQPAKVRLTGPRSQQLLLVHGVLSNGERLDYSRKVRFSSSQRGTATVSDEGIVRPAADGGATIKVSHGSISSTVPVSVDAAQPAPPSFLQDVVPALTQAGCNSLACHGSPAGKNGFKLSMYGADPAADHQAIVRQPRSTPEKDLRVDLTQAERSLILRKATMDVPHLGGLRFKKNSDTYDLLLEWLRSGAPMDALDPLPRVAELKFTPPEIVRPAGSPSERLLLTAVYSDGTSEDVTHKAIFSSNDDSVATLSPDDEVEVAGVGETLLMARYLGSVGTVPVLSPLGGAAERDYAGFSPVNYIDRLSVDKWKKGGFAPSALTTDAEFLRRVFLDLIGTLPTPEEIRAFLADTRADKREQVVQQLLSRPEYADWWSVFWGDLLRNNSRLLQQNGALAFRTWIRDSLAENKPYDRFVRELVTATGDSFTSGPANFYRVARTPGEQAEQVAQVFLGMRIQCANCHNHPFEKWTRNSYHQFAAFFAQVQARGNGRNGTMVSNNPSGAYRHPETNRPLDPAVLAEDAPPPRGDQERREALADWLCSSENLPFARSLVNRLWAQLFGRGIVEPADDIRVTNPAVNEPLLDALARDFIAGGFDVQKMLRTITASRTYQLSSVATERNAGDRQSFSRAYMRRLKAEVLLDAICQVTNQPESYNGHPAGTRAIQLVDNRVPSYFMDTFGRPRREVVCTCEREEVANITQALHLINGDTLHRKLRAPQGRLAELLKSGKEDREILDELYLWSLGRSPTEMELATAAEHLQRGPRQDAWEDLLWMLLNSREFLFNH